MVLSPMVRAPMVALPSLPRLLCSVAIKEPSSPQQQQQGTRFAIVQLSNSQYKVAPDDQICIEKIRVPVGASIAARRVLLVGDEGATVIGTPLIKDAAVHLAVEEQGFGKKVIVFKKKRRKGYRRWKGHRSRLTLLRVTSIELPPDIENQMSGSG